MSSRQRWTIRHQALEIERLRHEVAQLRASKVTTAEHHAVAAELEEIRGVARRFRAECQWYTANMGRLSPATRS